MNNIISAENRFALDKSKKIISAMEMVDRNLASYYEAMRITNVDIDDDGNMVFDITVKPYKSIDFIEINCKVSDL